MFNLLGHSQNFLLTFRIRRYDRWGSGVIFPYFQLRHCHLTFTRQGCGSSQLSALVPKVTEKEEKEAMKNFI